ncbi:MAG: hypothetical protein ACOYYS_05025 [Chloroflexota bacterium]
MFQPSQVDVGLVRPEDRYIQNGHLPQSEEFHIADGQALNLDLVLMSGEDSTFLVTVLVDYLQTPFTFDGRPGLLHQIDIQAGKDLFVPVSLNVRGAGAHDVMFVVFKDPYRHPATHELRSARQCPLGGKRAVVVVSGDSTPLRSFQPDLTGTAPPPDVTWGTSFLFASPGGVHPSQPEGQMRLVQEGQAGQAFAYKIWMSSVGDTQARSLDYALIKFFNYHQVSFSGRNVLFVRLAPQQEILFDDFITLPHQAGMHELQIVYVLDPYRSLLQREVATPFVYASDCLGIEVP